MMQFWWTFITTLYVILLTFPWMNLEKSIISLSPIPEPSHSLSPMQVALDEGYFYYLLCSKEGKNKNLTWSKFKFINHSTSKSIQSGLTSDRAPAWLLLGSQDLKEHLRPEEWWLSGEHSVQQFKGNQHPHADMGILSQCKHFFEEDLSPLLASAGTSLRTVKSGTFYQPEEIILPILNKCPQQFDWIKN